MLLPAAVVPTPAAVEARGPHKMQQRLVLDTVWQGKIPWRKRVPTWRKRDPTWRKSDEIGEKVIFVGGKKIHRDLPLHASCVAFRVLSSILGENASAATIW